MVDIKVEFENIAKEPEGSVDVNISYDIIRQFSAQLYTNPRKAIEELVCNSYDAGANKCYIYTPQSHKEALLVLDNGQSMDFKGLQDLWVVARSPKVSKAKAKQNSDRIDNKRAQIGKFGIGKLAAFALGRRLTHIATVNGSTRLVSVGVPEIEDKKNGKPPSFNVYKLEEEKARQILSPLFKNFPKPWEMGWSRWTLALVEDIEEGNFGRAIKAGFLKKMISTAIPVSSKFKVWLDGEIIPKREIDQNSIVVKIEVTDLTFKKHLEMHLKSFWKKRREEQDIDRKLDEDYKCKITTMSNPEDIEEKIPALFVPSLGTITGNAILSKNTLTTQKLSERGYRDNGFAVYVRGKLINPEDELFGISARSWKYWRRFLAQVEIPGLDNALLVQRNMVSENRSETLVAREVLRVLFNHSRNLCEEKEESDEYNPGSFGARLIPLSPFHAPLALQGLAGGHFPKGGLAAVDIDFVTLGEEEHASKYDVEEGRILINEEHPLIMSLVEIGAKSKEIRHVFGEVLAGDLLAKGYLRSSGVEEQIIQDVEEIQDASLYSAAGFIKDKVEAHIQEIEEASLEGGKRFELAVVKAFRAFRLSTRLYGKSDEQDAIISIPKAGKDNLLISVEAKGSKGVVTHKDLSEASVNRHREDKGCSSAIAIARAFQLTGSRKKDSALIRETKGKIPLITTDAIAIMLKLHNERSFTYDQFEKILTTWKHPDDLPEFIESVWKEFPDRNLMKLVLEVAHDHMDQDNRNYPDPGMVVGDERIRKKGMTKEEIVKIIQAVAITTGYIVIHKENEFELLAPPEIILDKLAKMTDE